MLISKTKIRLYALSIMTSLSFMYGCTTTPSATTPTFVANIEKFNATVAFAYNTRKMYFASQIANSSIKNLKAMEFAATQVGVSGETMEQANKGMAMAFRSEPGLSEFVKNLGIPVSGRFQCGCILDLYKSNTHNWAFAINNSGSNGTAGYEVDGYVGPITNIVYVVLNGLVAPPLANKITSYVNGAVAPQPVTDFTATTIGNFGSFPLFLFARNSSQYFISGKFYGMIIIGTSVTATEFKTINNFLATKSGIQW